MDSILSDNSPLISVGIPVSGMPILESRPDGTTLLRNMTIGLGFHWQHSVAALLPGEIIDNGADSVYPLINRLPVETYLECVVGSEMSPFAPAEFLKAHAVISRSWAMGKIAGCHPADSSAKVNLPERIVDWEDTCDHHGFDVCSDDHCQRYQGLQPLTPEIRDAIRATAGEFLCDEAGNLVDARFSKCCGGQTEVFSSCWQPREEACLVSIRDPWCDLTRLPAEERNDVLRAILKDYDLQNEGGYRWDAQVSAAEIRERLKQRFHRDVGDVGNIEVTQRGASGRAVRLRVDGSEGSVEIGKELMIRRLLAPTHLYSSWIEIERDAESADTFHLHGRGWGHGVGLCQIGAARMALQGYSYRDILSFYYPGSHLSAGFADLSFIGARSAASPRESP